MALSGSESTRVVPIENLQEWFRQSVSDALVSQRIQAEPHTEHYLVNLLTVFTRAENLYEHTSDGCRLQPLAVMLAEALESPSAAGRDFALQRLGDISLFIAGFFSESLSRKLIDIDYYTRMGGTAYGTLSEISSGSIRTHALADVFRELADRFMDFVDVLSEVAQMARVFSGKDVLRLYEVWLRTGSKRAARKLRELGVEPSLSAATAHPH